eukprot:322237-Chlamydomonas_euryale.AAC.2
MAHLQPAGRPRPLPQLVRRRRPLLAQGLADPAAAAGGRAQNPADPAAAAGGLAQGPGDLAVVAGGRAAAAVAA